MRAFVINLARRPDRLAATEYQLNLLGIPFRRIEAIDAGRVSRSCLACRFTPGGPLGEVSAGDMACTLSHLKALRTFLHSGEPYGVILEDDIYISPYARQWLASDGWIPRGVDLIKLERFGPRRQSIVVAAEIPVADRTLAELLSKHCGAAAYIVSREAAQCVLQQSPLSLPIDHLLFNVNNSPLAGRLVAWQLKPALCEQQPELANSTDIAPWRRLECPTGLRYLRRELVRAYYELCKLPLQIEMILCRRANLELITLR